jgi:hypothetical protein
MHDQRTPYGQFQKWTYGLSGVRDGDIRCHVDADTSLPEQRSETCVHGGVQLIPRRCGQRREGGGERGG